jgi:nitrite reductase/ring-hydroxylating ferredoxin subunit
MPTPDWIRVARLSEFPSGATRELVAGGRVIALFHVAGTIYALDGICPHQGGPLGKGTLAGCVVTCPWHGWQFDVCSGQHQLNSRIVQPRFDVRVEGEWILVDLG